MRCAYKYKCDVHVNKAIGYISECIYAIIYNANTNTLKDENYH